MGVTGRVLAVGLLTYIVCLLNHVSVSTIQKCKLKMALYTVKRGADAGSLGYYSCKTELNCMARTCVCRRTKGRMLLGALETARAVERGS